MDGTIKKLTEKRFGFIRDASGHEYFFHESALKNVAFDTLKEGQKVTFTEGQGPKGPRAEDINVAV